MTGAYSRRDDHTVSVSGICCSHTTDSQKGTGLGVRCAGYPQLLQHRQPSLRSGGVRPFSARAPASAHVQTRPASASDGLSILFPRLSPYRYPGQVGGVSMPALRCTILPKRVHPVDGSYVSEAVIPSSLKSDTSHAVTRDFAVSSAQLRSRVSEKIRARPLERGFGRGFA